MYCVRDSLSIGGWVGGIEIGINREYGKYSPAQAGLSASWPIFIFKILTCEMSARALTL